MGKERKGQYFAFDAITATIIFMLTVSLLFSYWFNIQSVINAYDDTMLSEAVRISDMLVSPGYPEDWNESMDYSLTEYKEVGTFGLATSSNNKVLSWMKIAWIGVCSDPDLYEDCYKITKESFRTGYDYYVIINYTNGAGSFDDDLSFGKLPTGNATSASFTRLIAVDRIATVDSGYMTIILWKEH